MNKSVIATAAVALLIGGGIGYFASPELAVFSRNAPAVGERKALFYRNSMNPSITSSVPTKDEMGMDYVPVYAEDNPPAERKPLFYRNPMNPAITSPAPAKDEMGMDYVPVYAENDSGQNTPAGTVRIDSVAVQNMGVRTATATLATMTRNIRTVGRVAYDEQRLARLHPKYEGWVEKLFVDRTGERVKKGDTLLSIYSPQLVATQEEFLLALDSVDKLQTSPFADVREGAKSLLSSAKERLQLLDISPQQIRQLQTTRKASKAVQIQSPFNGILMNIGVRSGERVRPETELYMIADLSRIWVIVDLYEDDMPWVREGAAATMKVAGIPGKRFSGRVTFIYPYLEAKTRTVKVRLEFDNRDLSLKPDMFADVDILADPQLDAVLVPSEAIVRTGTQEQIFVQRAPGQFEPRSITIGVSSDGQTQIISGLRPGEVVVTSGQFLIDSESKLKEATAKMLAPAKPSPAAGDGTATPATSPETAPTEMRQHTDSSATMQEHAHGGSMATSAAPPETAPAAAHEHSNAPVKMPVHQHGESMEMGARK